MIVSKCFVIGMNKTGTSSFHFLCLDLGLRSVHCIRKNYSSEELARYDCFSDNTGLRENFRELFEKYPDALFILNTRPLGKWLTSRYKHAKKRGWKARWCWPPSRKRTLEWIERRAKLHKDVCSFFSDRPKSLILLNVESQGWEDIVSRKLVGKARRGRGVHANKSIIKGKKMRRIKQAVAKGLASSGHSRDLLLYPGWERSECPHATNI